MQFWSTKACALLLLLAVQVRAESRGAARKAADPPARSGARSEAERSDPSRLQLRFSGLERETGPLKRLVISRGLPPELGVRHAGDSSSPTARKSEEFTILAVGSPENVPETVGLTSLTRTGQHLDSLTRVPLHSVRCPEELSRDQACARSGPLRLVAGPLDRRHPAITERSLIGQVGGNVVLQASAKTERIPVAGPRELDYPRYRVTTRTRILRTYVGGPPAVGTSDDEALAVMREALGDASAALGQCGWHLGTEKQLDIQVIDPPRLSLLAVGCRLGVRASGGEFKVTAPSGVLVHRIAPGATPYEVASGLQQRLKARGYLAQLFRNAQVESSALPTFDILLTDQRGQPVPLSSGAEGLSSDPTMPVCLGEVDFGDGIEHFDDLDAAAGTLEERTLLRAIQDHDPATIDIVVVPEFAGLGRIGESFIFNEGGSLQNALIVDRSGIRALSRSMTLAHELGHVLLNLPGHPDDFGVDQPSQLMDADAADATIFGPRRLSLEECFRAIKQSGPNSPVPLIVPGSAPSERSVPEGAAVDTARPDTARPETAEPETAEPETAEPETAEPDTAELNGAGAEQGSRIDE